MGDYKQNPKQSHKVKTPKSIRKRIAMYDRKTNKRRQ